MLARLFPPVYSGAGVQALRLCQELMARDVQVSVLTVQFPGLKAVEEVQGIRVYRLPERGNSARGRLWFAWDVARFLIAHQGEYDVLHMHSVYRWFTYSSMLLCNILGKPTIVKLTLLGSNDPLSIRRQRWGGVKLWVLGQAHRMVCLSSELYRRCIDDPMMREEQLVCIPNGVDTEEFMPVDSATQRTLRQSLSIPLDQPVVIYVGILAHRKGTDVLLRAWQPVLRQRPGAVLLLVGPLEDPHNAFADEVSERLPQWVEACPPGSVMATGRVETVAAYLQAADIFVLPSRSEGLPNVLLEAMATGLACVGSRISGITDVVSDGVDALLFDSECEEELAACLLRLLDDASLRAELGRAARQTVETRFSLVSVADAYKALYDQLIREQ